jgi:hypothetical protein
MLSNSLLIPHGKVRREGGKEGGKGRWEGKVGREGAKDRCARKVISRKENVFIDYAE